MLTWVDGEYFVDPVYVRIRLAETLPQLEEFEVCFGDASAGIGKVGFDQKPPTTWNDLAKWQLRVAGAGYPGST